MAREETKGFLKGQMKFGVGDDVGEVEEAATLLPLRVLLLADLVPGDDWNAGASAPPNAIRVTSAELDQLFAKLRPRIALEVPSVVDDGRMVRVDLSPSSLKSFRPDGLCAEVPLLRALLDGRLVLERLREGQLSELDARTELDRLWSGGALAREVLGLLPQGATKAPPAPAAPKAPVKASVDSLLDLVDLSGTGDAAAEAPEDAPKPAGKAAQPSKYGDLIASFVRSARGGAGGKVSPAEAISRVERALGLQLGAILQHPEVRRLEEAYRGVKLVLERAESHRGILFDVVSARPADMPAAFARTLAAGAGREHPVSFAVVDVSIDGSAASLALLEAIAKVAEEGPCPAVLSAKNELFGTPSLAEVEKLDHKAGVFEAKERVGWRATAGKPSLLWVSMATNRVLARTAYTKSSSRVREAAVAEQPADSGATVWTAPAYALGALVVQSFRQTGWPCRIVGPRAGGVLGNLPVHEVAGANEEGEIGAAIPTEVFLSTETQRELARIGVLALASAPNTDAVVLLQAPTAYVPPPKKTWGETTAGPEIRAERASLVDQLFVARVAQFLRALCGKLPAAAEPSEAAGLVEGALAELFADASPGGPEAAVKGHRGPNGTSVEVVLRPRRFLGVTLEEVGMEMPLG